MIKLIDILKEDKNLRETLTKKEYLDFFTDLAWFLSMNLSQVHQQATDKDAQDKLKTLMQNLRKPIINGMNIFDVIDIKKNKNLYEPKMLSAILSQIRELLVYIEPQIKKYVKDGDRKTTWLQKIEEFKTRYKSAI